MTFARGRPCLLTLDAFGTLFHPRQPIGQQYAETARRHGLSGFTDQDVEASFRKAFKHERKERPNYGKAVGMDATRWWTNVIQSTFTAVQPSLDRVPEVLVASLLHRFSSNEGYQLYDDVKPFFNQLKHWRDNAEDTGTQRLDPSRFQVGVLSNSDDRVSGILANLGIRVNDRRPGSEATFRPMENSDIDCITLSYDVGFEKPDRRMFDAAMSASGLTAERNSLYLHVGDNPEEDYLGALQAGWQSLLLDRGSKLSSDAPKAERVESLSSILQRLTEGE